MWVTSKPKRPRLPVQAGPELPRDQSCYMPNSCPARSYSSSRLPREPERNTRHQDPGQQLQQVKSVKRLGSPLTNLDQPTNRHDTHLKLIWKCFEWKHVKETRPEYITNNQTEVKQATSTQREHHHTCDTPWCGLSVSQRAQHIRHPIQAGPELPRHRCHSLPNSCPARSYWSSRLLREPERNTRHQRSGSTATSKMSKETWLASDQPRQTYESTWHSLEADLEMLRMKACQTD